MERIKQVILIRKDLNMRRGKEIAQGSHASMQFITDQVNAQLHQPRSSDDSDNNFERSVKLQLSDIESNWLNKGMAKVCLRVESESQLLEIHEKAISVGLKSYLIEDSGRTEFKGKPTITACAIGPDEVSKIDAITGELTLY